MNRSLGSLVLAVACAISAAGCNSAAGDGSSPSAAPVPARAQAPAATPSAGVAVTITGQVMQIYATGNFVLSDGKTPYTVAMTATTSAINLRGREVPRQFIQVAGSVTVTGLLSDSMITATVVSIPTIKDGP